MSPWDFLLWVAAICMATGMVFGVAGGVAFLLTWLEDRSVRHSSRSPVTREEKT